MQMQEPEQKWQDDQPYDAYRSEDSARYGQQEQKIHPKNRQLQTAVILLRIIAGLSWVAVFLTIPGIVAAANILENAYNSQTLLEFGIMGLVSSIVAVIIFLTIFILSVIAVAKLESKKRPPR